MQAIGQLDHRHIVPAHDAREIEGHARSWSMEYLGKGSTSAKSCADLDRWLSRMSLRNWRVRQRLGLQTPFTSMDGASRR